MSAQLRRFSVLLLVIATLCGSGFASAYNARPKIVVVIVVDQLRGDLLERYHDQLPEGGFRMLMDNGAWFSNCNYQYANTRTGPGHATIGTGTYTRGHGIVVNDWYDAIEEAPRLVRRRREHDRARRKHRAEPALLRDACLPTPSATN